VRDVVATRTLAGGDVPFVYKYASLPIHNDAFGAIASDDTVHSPSCSVATHTPFITFSHLDA
jgi:hypothetical protein